MAENEPQNLAESLEVELTDSLAWVAFEPNGEVLWARVRTAVRGYLAGKWRDDALEGRTEEDTFFVVVGRETMTEDDIQNGRLIVEIGIAPVRPAEFVIFRVFQKTRLQD
jgi:phage tail sheath protein FI